MLRIRLLAQVCIFLALTAVAANLGDLSVAAIGLYQDRLPHAWKRPCAFQHLRGGESCSVYARRAIGESGFLAGMRLSLDRFAACGRMRPAAGPAAESAVRASRKEEER